MNLMRVEANSQGKKNVLERSELLTDFRWTPIRDVITHKKIDGCYKSLIFPAGKEVAGIPYSSNEVTDKFICENVSFETLLSAMKNPDSVLYTKSICGYRNASTYYGIVCNGLVRYALDIKPRYSTKRWHTIAGMNKIADCESYSVDEIELCDVLYAFGNGRNHVALITGILKDDSGVIKEIEVSEATYLGCVRRSFEIDVFYEKYKLFELWRYDFVDDVPACDPEDKELLFNKFKEYKTPYIAVDYGNKSNYFLGEDTVISVFRDGDNKVSIYKDGSLCEEIEILGKGKIVRKLDVGYYRVTINDCEDVAEFRVNFPVISHEVKDGVIVVRANAGDADAQISHMDFREANGHKINPSYLIKNIHSDSEATIYTYNCYSSLSKVIIPKEEEIEAGVITAEIPEDAGFFKVTFKNKYGLWTHQMIEI